MEREQFHESIDKALDEYMLMRLHQARIRAIEEAAEMVRMRVAISKSKTAQEDLTFAARYLDSFAKDLKIIGPQ